MDLASSLQFLCKMKKKIELFLVDDHRIFIQSFEAFLIGQEHFQWRGSADGSPRTCQEIIRLNPDVVLLDYHLRDLNGIDLLKQLREQQFKGKIVFLTMNREKHIRTLAELHSADGFVSKEVDGHELMEGLIQLHSGVLPYLALPDNEKELDAPSFGLTRQEKLVAELICSGMPSESVAAQLEISIHTVYTHRRRILEKTGATHFLEVCKKIS